MIGKPKVMICIGMICLGAFLTHSSDIRAAELRESEVEDELREDEDADTEIVFDADTAINRTAAKSALADLHGVLCSGMHLSDRSRSLRVNKNRIMKKWSRSY